MPLTQVKYESEKPGKLCYFSRINHVLYGSFADVSDVVKLRVEELACASAETQATDSAAYNQ